MSMNTFSTEQILLHDQILKLAFICRSVVNALGTGECKLNTCESCAWEHDYAVQLAQEAVDGMRRLKSELERLGVIPAQG